MSRQAFCRVGRRMPAIALGMFVSVVTGSVRAEVPETYRKLWNDPEVESRIRTGIEANRMGTATLRFADSQGKPVQGVDVEFKQIRHEFLFGCNAFMADSFPTPEKNRRYEDAFKNAFNFATAPFYWSALEPEEGKPRFTADSKPIYRRPPPDVVVRFCQRNDITIKGHTLIYHGEWLPKWLSKDPRKVEVQIRHRFQQIAQRYGKGVAVWDVVNEPLDSLRVGKGKVLPSDYTFWSMKEASQVFPRESVLMVNHNHPVWADALRLAEESHYYLLIQSLLLRNVRLDAIGIQLHTGCGSDFENMIAGKLWRPQDLLTVLDLFGNFQKPIHITELTFPTRPEGPQGEEIQAAVLRNLYRLWFSHPKVEAITYWDLVDGTTWQDSWHGGLLRKDLSPKPAYQALTDLVHKEWHTSIRRNSGGDSEIRLRGFFGDYEVTAKANGKTVNCKVRLTRAGTNEFPIPIP